MTLENFKSIVGRSDSFFALDMHFADLMLEFEESERPELWFAAALVSQQTRRQHVCLDLKRLTDPLFALEIFAESETGTLPSPKAVADALGAAKVVGKPGEFHPLILDEANRLYLYRYWEYEQKLADALRARAQDLTEIDASKIKEAMAQYFDLQSGSPDWQSIAAAVALSKKIAVISGGPGTGKTHTIGIILALLNEQLESPAIKLTAPTGKAAVRLRESIKKLTAERTFPEEVQQCIPDEATTIHRLLGWKRFSPYFRHSAVNPLDADVVVVDEASMVALPLMAKLVQALPEHARLILLGDQYQLASVEAGSVLADICDAGDGGFSPKLTGAIQKITGYEINPNTESASSTELNDCVVQLKKNFRFKGGGILELSEAVNAGDTDAALEVLKTSKYNDVEWHDYKTTNFWQRTIAAFKDFSANIEPEAIFKQFEDFRILCAVREGPQGVRQINHLIERAVKEKMKIARTAEWYPGQPLLITKNDYTLELFNGDVGIILPDRDNSEKLRAHFQTPEGEKKLRPFRLPEHEVAYAMTVHKSQGSEFERVILLLPEKDSPVLTRELIYTAITRASQKVEIWGSEDIFRAAVSRPTLRRSGLKDAFLNGQE